MGSAEQHGPLLPFRGSQLVQMFVISFSLFPFTDVLLLFPWAGECRPCRTGKTLHFIKPPLAQHSGARFSLFAEPDPGQRAVPLHSGLMGGSANTCQNKDPPAPRNPPIGAVTPLIPLHSHGCLLGAQKRFSLKCRSEDIGKEEGTENAVVKT